MKFKHLLHVVSVVVLSFGFIASSESLAQKPSTTRVREIRLDEIEKTRRQANMQIGEESGIPRSLSAVNYAAQPADPVTMAQQYLREHAQLLHLKADLSDLAHTSTRETKGGFHVRFQQQLASFPVYKAEIAVTINHNNVVTFVMNGYRANLNLTKSPPAISSEQALALAKKYLATKGRIDFEKTQLFVHQHQGRTRLAVKATIVPAEDPIGDWEALVDAHTGEVFKVVDNALHGRGDRGNSLAATGTGNTFDPDPITRSGATYGAGGFTDNNDADSGDLTAQVVSVTLQDLTFTGSQYQLSGPFAAVADFESPFKGTFSQATSTWNFTRSADAFEAVLVYYHIDKSMRYINQTLGVSLLPFQYSGGVQVDPHGLSGQDNSHYVSSTGRVAFGEGGVDDSEDLEVVLHELGHGIHDWATNGQISQVDGLSEGSGDYWAASYTRSLGFWQSPDPEFHWVFRWDGHNPFWAGRILNYSATYPGGLTGSIHTDGQMWSSTLMSIWNDIGKTATDENFLEALSMLNSSSSQNDAANAFYQADLALHGGANQAVILNWFTLRGYTIDTGAPPNAPTNLTATAVSSSQINLAWTQNSSDETGFKIERKTGAGGTYAQIATVGANVTSYSNTGLAQGTTYFYQVRAYNGSGNSAYTDEASATTQSAPVNLALNKPAAASSTNGSNVAGRAVDGSTSTFWRSGNVSANTVAWLRVDLQTAQNIGSVTVNWRSSYYARRYQIQVSNDDTNWTTVYSDLAGNGGIDNISFAAVFARYVRVYMTRNNSSSERINEFEVYGGSSAAPKQNADEFEVTAGAVPVEFELAQNYPNPFNPSTTITYGLPEAAHVKIALFNVLGEQVDQIVEGLHAKGRHTITYAPRNLPSGVYFYMMQAGEIKLTRRLVLMK